MTPTPDPAAASGEAATASSAALGVGEARLQLGLTLAVGAVAACASWSHVLDLAEKHGQGGWLAWAVAACIETSAVSAGLEVRRRRRVGARTAFPLTVLLAATVLQLAAQVAQAEQTPWGVILAAVPAVTFLTLVKLTVARPAPTHNPQAAPVAPEPAPVPVAVHVQASTRAPLPAAPAQLEATPPAGAGPDHHQDNDDVHDPMAEPEPEVGDLLLLGRAVADELAREGLPLNRRNLLAGIRARGRSCSTERASALLRALRAA